MRVRFRVKVIRVSFAACRPTLDHTLTAEVKLLDSRPPAADGAQAA